jgi:hypothetical protein
MSNAGKVVDTAMQLMRCLETDSTVQGPETLRCAWDFYVCLAHFSDLGLGLATWDSLYETYFQFFPTYRTGDADFLSRDLPLPLEQRRFLTGRSMGAGVGAPATLLLWWWCRDIQNRADAQRCKWSVMLAAPGLVFWQSAKGQTVYARVNELLQKLAAARHPGSPQLLSLWCAIVCSWKPSGDIEKWMRGPPALALSAKAQDAERVWVFVRSRALNAPDTESLRLLALRTWKQSSKPCTSLRKLLPMWTPPVARELVSVAIPSEWQTPTEALWNLARCQVLLLFLYRYDAVRAISVHKRHAFTQIYQMLVTERHHALMRGGAARQWTLHYAFSKGMHSL